MDALTISAASGMRARMESLELLANNIANQSTAGYKTDREFYNLYVSPEASQPGGRQPTALPVIERQWTDFSQGTLTTTGNPLDVAISGEGFFAVAGADSIFYTRNGSFRISPSGALETADGLAVLDSGSSPIRLDPTLPVQISETGVVLQDDIVVAELGVVSIENPELLAKHSGVYFRLTDAQITPQRATGFEVHQGKLESANFSPAEAAVRLVDVLRQFEILGRAVELAGEMNRSASEDVARVGS